LCCDGIVIVTEVPLIGKCTGGDGGVVGEGEGVGAEALDIVIDREVDSRFRIDGDINFSGVNTIVVIGNIKCNGVGTWVSVGIAGIGERGSISIAEFPEMLCTGSGISGEVIELEGVTIETLSGVIDGEPGFWREVDGDIFS
jgi:hypothetical protein